MFVSLYVSCWGVINDIWLIMWKLSGTLRVKTTQVSSNGVMMENEPPTYISIITLLKYWHNWKIFKKVIQTTNINLVSKV